MKRLSPLPLVLAVALGAASPSAATNTCARADIALFRVRAHDRIAIHVRHLGPHQRLVFDLPGVYRVRHANRRGRAVLRVRPRRSGKASVTVRCNQSFTVRVTELED